MQNIFENHHRFVRTEDYDNIRLWADLFGVSVDELRFAIREVGNDVEQLRRYLAAYA